MCVEEFLGTRFNLGGKLGHLGRAQRLILSSVIIEHVGRDVGDITILQFRQAVVDDDFHRAECGRVTGCTLL